MTLIQALKSNTFAIYISIASVIVQSFHSFYAFYKISSLNGTTWGMAQAVLFALIVDAAVLFYTVRKNTKVTWMAAFVMVLINLYVYYTHLGLSFDFILGALISLVIPVSNYFYSEEITDEAMDVEYEPGQREEVLKLEKRVEELINDNRDLGNEMDAEAYKAQKYITELREEIKAKQELYNQMLDNREAGKYEEALDGTKIVVQDHAHIPQQPQTAKGFASLKSPAQEGDKSLLNVVPNTDRPSRT